MTLRSVGIKIDPDQIERLRVLAAADRRSVGFLVRDAVAIYLDSRRNEINELKRMNKKKMKHPGRWVPPVHSEDGPQR